MGRHSAQHCGPRGPVGVAIKAHPYQPRNHAHHHGPWGIVVMEAHADHGGWGDGPGYGPGAHRHGRRGPGRRGRGPRASRGDIRAAILALLAEEPMHGYQVMREINERSGGVWRPSPGSIYPTLQQLQDEGLVESEEQRRGRKLFVITDEGRAEVATREGQPAPWEQVGDEFTSAQVGLRDLVFQIGAAAKQVMIAGTPEQASRAEALLKETRRGLYRILAEDEPQDGAGEAPSDGATPAS